MLSIKDGACFYGGTKDNGVWLLALGDPVNGRCLFMRADHCWHVVDSYDFTTMTEIMERDIHASPENKFGGGWRSITREEFDKNAKRILSEIQRIYEARSKTA